MIFHKEIIWRRIRILALYFGASVVQSFFMCSRCNSFESYFRVIAFTFCLWLALWDGNAILAGYIDKKVLWMYEPVKRFVIGLISTILYTLVAIYGLIMVFSYFFGFNFGGSVQFTVTIAVVFTVLIALFLHSREFLFFWRKSELEVERFQRERISSRYESLKNKVNPQLLFKSLLTLDKLVHADKEKAIRFIKHLSEVYRYILDSREKDVAPIEKELQFLRSFFFLLNARFGESVQIDIAHPEKSFHISPLSIQIILETLTENATFSPDLPLRINIRFTGRKIHVEASNICWTFGQSRERVQEVLGNISDRYNLLSDVPVTFAIEGDMMVCEIPSIDVGIAMDEAETKPKSFA